MYATHWGLVEPPFGAGTDLRWFHQSPTHEETLARLHFLVDNRRRLGLLVGPAGCGKSLTLCAFADQRRRAGDLACRISLFGLGVDEFLAAVACELGVNASPEANESALWRTIEDRLTVRRLERRATVFLLDDVDRADFRLQTALVRLAQRDWQPEALLTIVVACRTEDYACVNSRLADLIELRAEIELWGEEDTAEFLRKRTAGANRKKPIFSNEAAARLHVLSQGVPRLASQLADLALVAGAGRELDQIDGEAVEAVYQELAAAREEVADV